MPEVIDYPKPPYPPYNQSPYLHQSSHLRWRREYSKLQRATFRLAIELFILGCLLGIVGTVLFYTAR